MFKRLFEIADPTLLRLTDTQKAVLLTVYLAQTPQLAYEAATGSEHIIEARNFLASNSLISVAQDGIKITSNGYEALISNGLIDEMGEITETGTQLMQWFEKEKVELAESLIPFRRLRNMLGA